MAKALQNPQMSINQALMNNPQFSGVMDFIKQNGGNPKTVFENLAQQMGVDPNEVLEQTKKQFNIK